MRLDKLTTKLQEAIQDTVGLATELGHQQIEPEHLTYSLVKQAGGIVLSLFSSLGIESFKVIQILEDEFQKK